MKKDAFCEMHYITARGKIAMKLNELFDFYLTTHFQDNNLKAFPVARTNIKTLKSYFGNKTLESLTQKDIRAFKTWRRENHIANGSIRRELSVLQKCLNIAAEHFDYDEIKIAALKIGKEKPKTEINGTMPTDDEILGILKSLRKPCYKRIMFVMSRIGYRRGELRGLTWNHVDLDKGVINLPKSLSKNGLGRVTPLEKNLQTLFRQMKSRSTCDHVFTDAKGKRMTVNGIYKPFRLACVKAGVIDENGAPRFEPHAFRKYATKYLRQQKRIPAKLVRLHFTGHCDEAIFETVYNIIDSSDLDWLQMMLKTA